MISLLKWMSLAAVCGVLQVVPVSAQEVPAAQHAAVLSSMRQKYYNLRTAGVKSYTCDVAFDWARFFAVIAGTALPAGDPSLTYLSSSHLRFTNDLSGDSKAAWAAGGTAPEEKAAKLEELRGDVRQMIDGFLQSWTPTLNGTLVPAAVDSLMKTPDGYLLHGETGGETTEERLDKSLTMTSLSVKSADTDTAMTTGFSPSAGGLELTALNAEYKQPPTAPASNVTMTASFQTVGGVQLPATLDVAVPNVAKFEFKFVGCTVEKDGPAK